MFDNEVDWRRLRERESFTGWRQNVKKRDERKSLRNWPMQQGVGLRRSE